ncbi:unnamed protein product, partial [Staurois parvus]
MTAAMGQTLDRLAGQRASGHQASGHWLDSGAPRHLARQWAPTSTGTNSEHRVHQVPEGLYWLDSGHRVRYRGSSGSTAGIESTG